MPRGPSTHRHDEHPADWRTRACSRRGDKRAAASRIAPPSTQVKRIGKFDE